MRNSRSTPLLPVFWGVLLLDLVLTLWAKLAKGGKDVKGQTDPITTPDTPREQAAPKPDPKVAAA